MKEKLNKITASNWFTNGMVTVLALAGIALFVIGVLNMRAQP